MTSSNNIAQLVTRGNGAIGRTPGYCVVKVAAEPRTTHARNIN